MVRYQIWDRESGNIVESLSSEGAAYDAVAGLVVANDDDWADYLSLVALGDDGIPVAMESGRELAIHAMQRWIMRLDEDVSQEPSYGAKYLVQKKTFEVRFAAVAVQGSSALQAPYRLGPTGKPYKPGSSPARRQPLAAA